MDRAAPVESGHAGHLHRRGGAAPGRGRGRPPGHALRLPRVHRLRPRLPAQWPAPGPAAQLLADRARHRPRRGLPPPARGDHQLQLPPAAPRLQQSAHHRAVRPRRPAGDPRVLGVVGEPGHLLANRPVGGVAAGGAGDHGPAGEALPQPPLGGDVEPGQRDDVERHPARADGHRRQPDRHGARRRSDPAVAGRWRDHLGRPPGRAQHPLPGRRDAEDRHPARPLSRRQLDHPQRPRLAEEGGRQPLVAGRVHLGPAADDRRVLLHGRLHPRGLLGLHGRRGLRSRQVALAGLGRPRGADAAPGQRLAAHGQDQLRPLSGRRGGLPESVDRPRPRPHPAAAGAAPRPASQRLRRRALHPAPLRRQRQRPVVGRHAPPGRPAGRWPHPVERRAHPRPGQSGRGQGDHRHPAAAAGRGDHRHHPGGAPALRSLWQPQHSGRARPP